MKYIASLFEAHCYSSFSKSHLLPPPSPTRDSPPLQYPEHHTPYAYFTLFGNARNRKTPSSQSSEPLAFIISPYPRIPRSEKNKHPRSAVIWVAVPRPHRTTALWRCLRFGACGRIIDFFETGIGLDFVYIRMSLFYCSWPFSKTSNRYLPVPLEALSYCASPYIARTNLSSYIKSRSDSYTIPQYPLRPLHPRQPLHHNKNVPPLPPRPLRRRPTPRASNPHNPRPPPRFPIRRSLRHTPLPPALALPPLLPFQPRVPV
jgi:hypothetical protein